MNRFILGLSATLLGAAGGYLLRSAGVGLAAEASVADGRPASRADTLARMDGQDRVAPFGTTLTYRAGLLE